ncbi:hypothetical protein BH20ACT14_BH20ACT14_16600 [soil metagenome]
MADGCDRVSRSGDGIAETFEGRPRREALFDPQLGRDGLGDCLGRLSRAKERTRENEARRSGVCREFVCERPCLFSTSRGKGPQVVGFTRV